MKKGHTVSDTFQAKQKSRNYYLVSGVFILILLSVCLVASAAQTPQARFEIIPKFGDSPFNLTLVDQSLVNASNDTSWNWTVRNETAVVFEQLYNSSSTGRFTNNSSNLSLFNLINGTYTVNLTVTDTASNLKSTFKDNFTVSNRLYPWGRFAVTPLNGTAPLNVTFIDTSLVDPKDPKGYSYTFNFDDNTHDVIQETGLLEHTYMNAGTYQPKIIISKIDSPSQTVTDYGLTINVFEPDPLGNPNASFIPVPGYGRAPLNVSFFGSSSGGSGEIATWNWEFDDGQTSDLQNPNHTFEENGIYQVNLTVTDAVTKLQSDKYSLNITVDETEKPYAAFTWRAEGDSTFVPMVVHFIDQSILKPEWGGQVNYSWVFDDGTFSNEQNPIHTFADNGRYNVTLDVKTPDGYPLKMANATINVETAPELVPSFIAVPTEGEVPLTVSFYDTTPANVTKWEWDFDDGSTSDVQNPVHNYLTAGTYEVTLNVADNTRTSTEPATKTVIVTEPSFLTSRFVASPLYGNPPLSVTFTDTSIYTGDIISNWTVTDIANSIVSVNDTKRLVCIFDEEGSFLVNHSISQNNITKYNSTIIFVENLVANFTETKSVDDPLMVKFDSTDSTGFPTTWFWSFGDGFTSKERSLNHTYSKPGNYTVKLFVSNDVNEDAIVKDIVV